MSLVEKKTKYLTALSEIAELDEQQRSELDPVVEKFAFRTNDYYQSLINWDDPHDPIRRIVMPDIQELEEFGAWDASEEASYTVVRGLEHKYQDAALLLVNNVCGAYCRFCFRKRLFTQDNDETINDISSAVEYIRLHPEINNVVLSGGDSLIMSTGKLERIIAQLAAIDHVRIIRIGSKIPAFNPSRIIGDPSLLDMIRRYTTPEKRIYLMAHFNHPRELTEQAVHGILLMQQAGATTFNQSPILRGVNDNAEVIAQLFGRLSSLGVVPYYLFICRPTAGNKNFVVPVEEALAILEQARARLSGVANSARLCMSHKSGKIEVVGKYGNQIIFRRHRSPILARNSEMLMFPCDSSACWFDDYIDAQDVLPVAEVAIARA
jgi:lysine 2,3-aminomutase